MVVLRGVSLSGICLIGLLLSGQVGDSERAGRAYYQRARDYFQHPTPTDRTDSLALTLYQKATRLLKPSPATAPLRFDCFEKIGILNQTFGNQPVALASYREAITTNRRFGLPDSLLFIPLLYSGSAHYFLQSFDSSSHYFRRAEAIYVRYPRVAEAQRLFNSWGALYYETGNYRQSINYFQKALQLQLRKAKRDSAAIYSYKSNIASSLRHLERYDSAATIYKSLLPLAPDADLLYINLGLTYLDKHEPAQALRYLVKVKANAPFEVHLENALGTAYLQQEQYTNAERHLQRSLTAHRRVATGRVKNHRIGLTYKLLGDIARRRQQPWRALAYYQRSIIELDYDFNRTDVYKNPQHFAPNFGGYLLFESLAAKADCWLRLTRQQPDERRRRAALDTYRSAFRLAEHIQKSFDNEEARLFVVQRIYPVYQQAVEFLVGAHEQTGAGEFLTEAFQWSEKSKAAVLAITIKENTIKSFSGIPDSLLARERNLRFNRSRLLIRSQHVISAEETERMAVQIRDTELSLSRLTSQLNAYPEYSRQKFSFDSVSVAQLRRDLLNSQTALLSYFHPSKGLLGFVLTRHGLHYFRVADDPAFNRALNALLQSLRTIEPGRAFTGDSYARWLYTKLIAPAQPHLSGVRSLIVIPHNELRLLPFEALQDVRLRYLLESYDVTYQYSATLLRNRPTGKVKLDNTLALAPFTGVNPPGGYSQLTASQQEVAPLKGTQLLGQSATKNQFLRHAGQSSVVHLATHAVVVNDDPQRSFVAFYPAGGQHRLYAHELLYGLLPETQLVFLSACETAAGRLIRGEGIMSLSRAFSFAGCPNLVTSLWKAEDNATAYVSTRFYAHLRAGQPFARALQRAKLDLLDDPEYAQFHAPQYWSHLVFIGSAHPGESSGLTYWVTLVLVTGLTGLGWWRRVRKRPASSAPRGRLRQSRL